MDKFLRHVGKKMHIHARDDVPGVLTCINLNGNPKLGLAASAVYPGGSGGKFPLFSLLALGFEGSGWEPEETE